MHTIDEAQCRHLLGTHDLGRLAVIVDDTPLVFPVNYASDGKHVAVRTDEGLKLDASRMRHVALEIDEIDRDTHTGWSVLVTGVAFEVTSALDNRSARLRQLRVEPWAPGPKQRWIRIDIDHISGRRLERAVSAPVHRGTSARVGVDDEVPAE
jgi:nitroimidazol reductase NimA-like FMN-containing flavoprotein (pyridoxamine 5'-phosphate oxidase superfamily)